MKGERPAPRLIKRYENRKLYDPAARRYVTLEELGAGVAAGQELLVQDQKSGQDLTTLTLAQVMLEGIRQSTARIPRQVLSRVIRLGTGGGGGGEWPGPQEAAARAREEAEKIVGGLLRQGRLTLEEALALRGEITDAVHRIVGEAQAAIESRLRGLLQRAEEDPNPSLSALKDRLETFEGYLERPRARKRGPREGTKRSA